MKADDYIRENLPIYQLCNVTVLPSHPLEGKARCKPNDINQNHFGTMHAAIQWMICELIGGIIFLEHFDLSRYLAVVKRTETDFVKPAFGEIIASGSMTKEQFDLFAAELDEVGKATFDLEVELTDSDGNLVAQTLATYHVRQRREK